MLYARFHAIRKPWLPIRRAVRGAVLAGLVPFKRQQPQQPAESSTQDPSATSEAKQNPTSNNNPVANLKQEDFQLFDQGKLPISLFSMETRETRREKAAATKTQVAGAEPIKSGNMALPDRFIALIFDDSHISLDDATYFRQVAPRFLDGVIPN
jgi:hypothetical protein